MLGEGVQRQGGWGISSSTATWLPWISFAQGNLSAEKLWPGQNFSGENGKKVKYSGRKAQVFREKRTSLRPWAAELLTRFPPPP